MAPRPATCLLYLRSLAASCSQRLRSVAGLATHTHASAAADADAGAADSDGLWLICGLGTPGKQYENTRHNIGFMAVDALAQAEGIEVRSTQLRALVGRGRIAGRQVLLVKPQTFMNLSGEAVVPLLRFYKVPPSRLLVLYDDLDIDVAALRLRKKGGHGGHNGMRSIVASLGGSQDFPRLRLGIGRPQGQREVVDHVLTTFGKAEATDVDVCIAQAGDAVRRVLTAGLDMAMNELGAAAAPAKPPKQPKAPRPPPPVIMTEP